MQKAFHFYAGLATQEEVLLYFQSAPFQHRAFYMEPCLWAQDIVLQMRTEGSIDSDRSVELLCKQITEFRSGLGTILCYDLISVPLVYTQVGRESLDFLILSYLSPYYANRLSFLQVAVLTVYSYTISSLFAWQFLDPNESVMGDKVDLYVPIFGLLRFVFYMGWIKVGPILAHLNHLPLL